MSQHTITIQEIAARANVSTATVSRILSGKSGHRASTMEAVKRISAELQREGAGQERVGRAPECIGIVMAVYPDFLNTHYNGTLATSILETLSAEGYLGQILSRTSTMLMDIDFFRDVIATYRIKGLIIPEFDTLYSISEELIRLNIPVVTVGNMGDGAMAHNVCADDSAGGRDAANYLWSRGHRRFGFLGLRLTDKSQRQRLEGFAEAVRTQGGDPASIWVKEFPSHTDSVTLAALELSRLPAGERPTALFSTNSLMTQKLLAALYPLGLRVPEDLSVISYEENDELLHLPVPVTTMAQPTRTMGSNAVRMLLRLLKGVQEEPVRRLSCSLNLRGSVRDA